MVKEVSILDVNGNQTGSMALNESVFNIKPNIYVMYLALRRQLNSSRSGTACVKTRAQVSGGGRKPWKQKGTGRARAGSLRSPLFVGGGVVFGPQPRNYSFSMPKKVRRLAFRSALSARQDQLIVVKDFSEISEPKTKLMLKALESLSAKGKILIIADLKAPENNNLELAARNLPNVKLLLPTNLNVKDLLDASSIVVTQKAINDIVERLK